MTAKDLLGELRSMQAEIAVAIKVLERLQEGTLGLDSIPIEKPRRKRRYKPRLKPANKLKRRRPSRMVRMRLSEAMKASWQRRRDAKASGE